MRLLFVFVLLLNLGLLAWGQGFAGARPVDQGRESRMLLERNEQAVGLGQPVVHLRQP
jgi:hypothetical protein